MVYSKGEIDKSVVEATEERFHRLYDDFDRVVVSFSGGKDSTVALNMAMRVARERDSLPVEVIHYDEEIVPHDTVDYANRVRQREEVDMRWLCWPMNFTNGVNIKRPKWVAWNPDKREEWVREKPEWAEQTPPEAWRAEKHTESNDILFSPDDGSIALVLGTRANESLARYRSVASSLVDNWISTDPVASYVKRAKPIYDWSYSDIWAATEKFGWDYNPTYDKLTLAGVADSNQRVSQPFNDTSLRGLWQYRKLYPELWDDMITRLPGANTALRYQDSRLYGKNLGLLGGDRDAYKTAIQNALEDFNPKERKEVQAKIQGQLKKHYEKTDEPIKVDEKHPDTKVSWKMLLKIAVQGDRRNSVTANI